MPRGASSFSLLKSSFETASYAERWVGVSFPSPSRPPRRDRRLQPRRLVLGARTARSPFFFPIFFFPPTIWSSDYASNAADDAHRGFFPPSFLYHRIDDRQSAGGGRVGVVDVSFSPFPPCREEEIAYILFILLCCCSPPPFSSSSLVQFLKLGAKHRPFPTDGKKDPPLPPPPLRFFRGIRGSPSPPASER